MKWTAFQNLTFRFFLIMFLKFRNFQPRYSSKIYSYKKESISVEFLVIFPVKTGPGNVAMYYKIKQYALKGFFPHFSIVKKNRLSRFIFGCFILEIKIGRQSNPSLTIAWCISLFQSLALNENAGSELYSITF